MNAAIEINNLRKRYGQKEVLKGLDFQIEQNEIFALLGVNGAGKTTTLECLEGLRPPSEGRIELHGTCGIQLQDAALPDMIKGKEAMALFLHHPNAKRVQQLYEELHLQELWNLPYHTYSTGQKRRLHLALALCNDPEIIFLDEPTAGLDIEGRSAIHTYLRGCKQQGKTIVLASHDMAEVEALCDRLLVLKDGEIAFLGTPTQFKQLRQLQRSITISFSSPLKFAKAQQPSMEQILSFDGLEETLRQICEACILQDVTIEEIKMNQMDMEMQFLKIAQKESL